MKSIVLQKMHNLSDVIAHLKSFFPIRQHVYFFKLYNKIKLWMMFIKSLLKQSQYY